MAHTLYKLVMDIGRHVNVKIHLKLRIKLCRMIRLLEYCELCNNGKRIGEEKKTRTQYTDFTWFGSVLTSMGMVAQ